MAGYYVGGGCCSRAYYGAPAQYVYSPPPPRMWQATVNYPVVYPYDPCALRPLPDGYGGWVWSVKAGCH